jgi:hypothetical protein
MTKNDFCPEHSGFEARITNLEKLADNLGGKVAKMQDDIEHVKDAVSKKINKIFILLITVLCGLVANMGVLFLRAHI